MEKAIIYGAGKRGSEYYLFLKHLKREGSIQGFCDKEAASIKEKCALPVYSYEEAVNMGMPFIIGVGKEFYDEVKRKFDTDGIRYYDDLADFCLKQFGISKTVCNREFCGYFHIDHMDRYFDDAETQMKFFWGNGVCYRLFCQMNPKNIIELACGRGRHVMQYLSLAEHVTLVDILEKNIEFCKDRFKDVPNISYYRNNGYDLSELKENTYTSLFTYDSMVHFELLDIAKYLQETYRVLSHGGMALFHHSNYSSDYRASFSSAPAGRSFMNKEIFAYLAYRCGFEVMEQQIVDWGGVPELDCLTLVRKNG